MDILHENCGGLIVTFDPENYGLCHECGEEGYFKVIRKETDAVYVVFTDITCIRE